MAVTNGYATVAELREQFGDDTKLTLALLERAINSASRAVDNFTGRRFWQDPAVKVRTYRPTGRVTFELNGDPNGVDISTTAGLVVKSDTGLDGTFATTWAATDFQLEPLNVDQGDAAFSWTTITAIGDHRFVIGYPRATLQITAQFGWSAVPDEVKQATLMKAARLFRRKESPLGVIGFDEFGATRITRHDSDVVEMLQPYVRAGI